MLWHCWLGYLTHINLTPIWPGGTLNLAQSAIFIAVIITIIIIVFSISIISTFFAQERCNNTNSNSFRWSDGLMVMDVATDRQCFFHFHFIFQFFLKQWLVLWPYCPVHNCLLTTVALYLLIAANKDWLIDMICVLNYRSNWKIHRC